MRPDAGWEPVHRLVAAWAQAAPEAPAVEDLAGTLTRGELNRRANRLAHRLRALGVGRDVSVAVCAERGRGAAVAFLAVLRAGGAYVPLDAGAPVERARHVLEDTAAPVVLLGPGVRTAPTDRPALRLDELAAGGPDGEPDIAVEPGDLAYVIYTSGTTGRPKGVMIEHGGLRNLVDWHRRAFSVVPSDRASWLAAVGFDASVWELWANLAAGAAVVAGPDGLARDSSELRRWLRRSAVTLSFLVTPIAELLLAEPKLELPHLRCLMTGGDRLTHCAPAGQPFRFVNLYGPTEATVITTAGDVPPEPGTGQAPPIGRPIDNVEVHVLDQDGGPVAAGRPGELCVGGAGLARGYRNLPELTAQRFVAGPDGVGRLYRTGDLVRLLPDGQLAFLGRLDDQVKVGANRVEPGEVEACLRLDDSVAAAAVVAPELRPGRRALVACVVPAPGRSPTPEALRAALATRLPPYMLPRRFAFLDALPLTGSGKVDRPALAELAVAGASPAPRVPPATELERELCRLWEAVLDEDDVGTEDDFFALGGDSVAAIQLAASAGRSGIAMRAEDLFRTPTIARLARLVGRASTLAPSAPLSVTGEAEAVEKLLVEPGGVEDVYPLTPLQEGLLFHSLRPGDLGGYRVELSWRLEGPLDPQAFAGAWREAAATHPVLRTVVLWEGLERPLQVVRRAASLPIAMEDWRGYDAADRRRHLEADRAADLDLRMQPVRLTLARTGDRAWQVVWTFHHLLLDGWSASLLLTDVWRRYEARIAGWAAADEPRPPFRDYVAWLAAQDMGASERWWRDRLAGWRGPTPLPLDTTGDRGRAERVVDCGLELTAALDRLARGRGLTLGTLVAAAWAIVLCRRAGLADVLFGMVTADRPPDLPGADRMLGLLLATAPVRVAVPRRTRRVDWLRRLQDELATVRQHAHCPLPVVAGLAGVTAGQLFDSVVTVENHPPLAAAVGAAAEVGVGDLSARSWTHYALSLTARSRPRLQLVLDTDRSRCPEAEAERLLAHVQIVLEQLTQAPEAAVEDLELLGGQERELVLRTWNDTTARPAAGCVHELVAAAAARRPEAVAATWGGAVLRHGELERRANQLARRLRALGVGPDVVVGVLAGRSPETLVGLLAVLKAGGAYLPLDPAYPDERIGLMAEECDVAAVLAPRHLLTRGPAGRPAVPLDGAPDWLDLPDAPVPPLAFARNLAYVIYTSGSTGRPKGVMVEHGSLANLVAWHRRRYRVRANDRGSWLAAVGFDAAVWECWPYLAAGAGIAIGPERLRSDPAALPGWLTKAGVTVCFLPTPLADAFLELPEARAVPLRALLTGGDRLSGYPPADLPYPLHNHYGPTEGCVVATAGEVPPAGAGAPTIGRPIRNVRAYVLDAGARPVPVGVPGELHLGGRGVARGYLGRRGQTAERFVPDPFGRGRLYRTGDVVRWRPDGELEFLGRLDRQVQLGGVRVEPGEVEAALRQRPDVAGAAVVVRPGPGGPRLVAYVVPQRRPGPRPDEVRAALGRVLPPRLVPSDVIELPALPLTQSGKLDRDALPEPERPVAAAAGRPPRGRAERELCRLWADVLRVERVGVDDDFFALGGDSLLGIRLAGRARELGFRFSPHDLFRAPTVAALAAVAEPIPAGEPGTAAGPGGGRVPAAAEERGSGLPLAPAGPLARRRLLATLPSAAEIEDWYPLTPAQAGLLFHSLAEPEAALYHPQLTCVVCDADREDLAAGFREAVARHPALRTGFLWEGLERPVQAVWRSAELPMTGEDWSRRLEAARREGLHGYLEADIALPFPLARPPLLRLALFALGGGRVQVALSFHHALLDGWSIASLLDEVVDASGSGSPPAPLPPFRRQVEWLAAQDPRAGEAHWRTVLAGVAGPTPLPERSVTGEHGFGRLVRALDGRVRAGLLELARRERLTLSVACHAAWALVLSDWGARPDVLFGTTVSGRSHAAPGAEAMIGLLVNSLPVRTVVGAETPLSAWLRSLADQLVEVQRLEHIPLNSVRAWTALPPAAALFESLVAFERYAMPARVEDVETFTSTNYPLNLVASDRSGTTRLRLTYHRSSFTDEAAGRLLDRWHAALADVAEGGDRPIGTLHRGR